MVWSARRSSGINLLTCLVTLGLSALITTPSAHAWEPTKPIEIIVPAGTGGGADQMARFLQGVIAKNLLSKQPVVVINKAGGAGAEGFLDVKNAKGEPHKLIITLSNLFTTPLATGVPFSWKDFTPVKMLALDEFVLWVNKDSPYKSVSEFMAAVKAGTPGQFKLAGTGSKQEDQIITVAMEKAIGQKMTYVPFKGGGEVAVQLVGNHVNATVNNPIEAVGHWKSGALRPLCVFDSSPMRYPDKITASQAWQDIPSCKSQQLPVEYLMLRGIMMAPGVKQDQVAYYLDLFSKVRALPEWKEFLQKGAYRDVALTGKDFENWLGNADKDHKALMTEAGFLAK